MRIREITEAVFIRDRAVSDVDGETRDLIVLLNPSLTEARAFLARTVEASRPSRGSLRGFVRETDGFIVIWDAYVAEHATVFDLLSDDSWWPRFSMDGNDFENGVVRNYIDGGINQEGWARISTGHFIRMLGRQPIFKPT